MSKLLIDFLNSRLWTVLKTSRKSERVIQRQTWGFELIWEYLHVVTSGVISVQADKKTVVSCSFLAVA